jgi:spectinomycin phosphotransferase
MKERPALQDSRIVDRLREAYGVEIVAVEFLPIGDVSSAKYRVVTRERIAYFLKLRRGGFSEISVSVPHCLHAQGIRQVLSPIETRDGRLWTDLEAYTCILYPYLSGRNGFQDPLSDDQWVELGAALKRVHSSALPAELQQKVPRETFSPSWREQARGFLLQAGANAYADPAAASMAALLRGHRDKIRRVIERAEALGKVFPSRPLERVLCHTDIHAGNILLEANGGLHMIDWDDPMLAPKERDLMFIGGGVGGTWNTPREEALFYQGYGGKDIHPDILGYYRCERIVIDVVEYSRQLLSKSEGGADRERGLEKFSSMFLPGQVLEIAVK